MRLFIAILLPDEVRTILLSAASQLREQSEHAQCTAPENFHLTLAFLGETDYVAKAKTALQFTAHRQHGPFSLTLDGFGRFGETVWAGIADAPPLFMLAHNLKEALQQQGFSLEERPFRPHITLARRVDAEEIQLQIPCLDFPVTSISLMQSEQRQGRLTYTELFRASL